MKLGLRDEVGGPKMAKTWFTALLAAAALLLGPGLAAGQDMSFDLDEAESAGGEGEAEAGTDKKPEGQAEGEAEAEGSASATASGDVLAELTAEGGPEQEKVEGGVQ